MTRYVNSYPPNKGSRHDPYSSYDGVDNDLDDDYDDDDDMDGFDDVSDYDDYDESVGEPNRSNRPHYAFTGDGRIHDHEARRHRSVSEGGGSIGLDGNEDNRRDHHNQLERKRRASIKSSYNDLREVVPSLQGSKASRADILRRAVECIDDLKKRNRDHSVCVNELRRRNDLLDAKNQDLLRCLQQLDNNNTAPVTYDYSYTPAVGSSRLCIPDTSSNPNNLPVLRLVSQENSERGTPSYRITPSGTTACSRSRPSPIPLLPSTSLASSNGLTGMNVLSAAVSLVASNRSAFSSTSSSVSNSDAIQPSSQRSSPGNISSSSSSNTSSFHQPSTSSHRRDRSSEERSLIADASRSSCDLEVGKHGPNDQNAKLLTNSPTNRTSTPPSIVLSIPARSTTTSSNSLNLSTEELTKRPRLN